MTYECWSDIKPGDRFGRLTVLSFAGKNDQFQPSFYCSCKCGTEVYLASAYGLLNGSIKGCNHCWQIKDLAGPRCPFPSYSCKKNKRGVCCHDCDEESTCANACLSSTAPFPDGCGRDKKVNL